MTSADPTVPDPLDPQAWNRYSYVGNDPLSFTDPSGFSWLSHFFHEVASYLQANPLVRSVLQIGLSILLANPELGFVGVFIAAMASAAIVTGLAGGTLNDDIRAAAIAGATAVAFYAVGGFTGHNPAFGSLQYVENIAGHAAVGCLIAVASGGACGPGAVAGAVGSAVAPIASQAGLVGGAAISGVAGGLASVAVGGKFADGAVTASFGYLFNGAAGRLTGQWVGGAVGAVIGGGPEDVPADVIGALIGGQLGSAIEDWFKGAVLSVNQNDLNHIFNNPGHNLDPVVQYYGGQEPAYNAVDDVVKQSNLTTNLFGVFRQIVSVGPFNLTVTGRVIGGIPRISNFWIP